MAKMKNNIEKNFNKYLVFAMVFLAMLLLNTYTIYTSDDISYQYVYESHMPTDNTRPIENIFDVIESINNHYQEVNGRSFSHFILQTLAIFPKIVFNICNSLVFLIAGDLIIRHIIRKKKNRTWDKYLIVYLALFIFIPQFGQSVLWISGSVNYIWMLCFILLASLAFVKWDNKEDTRPIGAILANLCAGLASENGAGMVILLGALFIFKWLIEKRNFPKTSFLALLAACLGLAYQLASPGNSSRLAGSGGIDLYENLYKTLITTGQVLGPLLIILFLAIISCKIKGGKISRQMPIFIISALAGSLVLVLTPNLAPRSWLWPVAFVIISIGLQLNNLKISKKKTRTRLEVLVISTFLLLAIPSYIGAFLSIFTSFNQHMDSLDDLARQKLSGNKDIVIEKVDLPENPYNPLTETYHLREDPDYWFNQWFAFHYGVDRVSISNPEEAR